MSGLRDHDPLSWIPSFSFCHPSLLRGFLLLMGIGRCRLGPGSATRQCKSRLSSPFLAQSLTIAWGLEVAGVLSLESRCTMTCCALLRTPPRFQPLLPNVLHKFQLSCFTSSGLALPFSKILGCLVSSNAGNETMVPSLGSPCAPFYRPSLC